MRSTRIKDLPTRQARITDLSHQDPIATSAEAVSPTNIMMMDNSSRPELRGTISTTLANMTKKSTKMSERTSTIFETRDVILMGAVSLTMKRKYAGVKNTSKSSIIRMQPSSHLTLAMLQIPTVTIPKGPKHSREHSEHSSGPVVSKSLGLSPMRDG